jgi:hypothetical protein
LKTGLEGARGISQECMEFRQSALMIEARKFWGRERIE